MGQTVISNVRGREERNWHKEFRAEAVRGRRIFRGGLPGVEWGWLDEPHVGAGYPAIAHMTIKSGVRMMKVVREEWTRYKQE